MQRTFPGATARAAPVNQIPEADREIERSGATYCSESEIPARCHVNCRAYSHGAYRNALEHHQLPREP